MKTKSAVPGAALLLTLCVTESEHLPAQEPVRRAVVPASAPDTIPRWIYADSNCVADSVQPAVYFYANVILVRFEPGTSQPDRQAAIEAVAGTVVGGRPDSSREGTYYVRIAAGRRIEPLRAAAETLFKMRQVARVWPIYRANGATRGTRHVVPAAAPDTLPIALLDALGTVAGVRYRQVYVPQIILVQFELDATQAQRQEAIEVVAGEVIGGIRSLVSDGFYYVRVAGANTERALLDIALTVGAMPAVASARPLVLEDRR